MSIKMASASYAAELTVNENGFLWITVTPRGLSEGFSAPLATETYLDIFETIQTLLSEAHSTFRDRQPSMSSASESPRIADD